MFTQAGFNWRRRALCRALVWRPGFGYARASALVRFYDIDSGAYTEYAWDGGAERFSWPHQVEICSRHELERALLVMLEALKVRRHELGRSELPQ